MPECPFIYVYDSAPINQLLINQLDAGFDDKINTDMILHRALLDSGCVVDSPESASFFFVPYYSSSRYHALGTLSQRPALCKLLHHMHTDWRDSYYWKRRGQRDHALVIAKIGEWYRVEKLIASTGSGLTLHTTEAITAHNSTVPLPYPIHSMSRGNRLFADPNKRAAGSPPLGLAFFAGSSVLNSMSGNHSTHLRRMLKWAMAARPSDCIFVETGRVGGSTHNLVNRVWKERDTARRIVDLSANYWFCPVPPGDSRSSARFYDSFVRLCIPVLFDNSWQLPFSWLVPYASIVVNLPASSLRTPEAAGAALAQLDAMSVEERVKRRELMLAHRHMFDLRHRPQRATGLNAIIRNYAFRARQACRGPPAGSEEAHVDWDALRMYCSDGALSTGPLRR